MTAIPSTTELEKRAKAGDQAALSDLFAAFRARLRRIVEVRLDNRLQGRIDPSDILQDAYIDLVNKLPDFGKRDSSMSLFVWMRLVATERVLIMHRKHLETAGRDVRREKQSAHAGSSIILAENLLAVFGSAENRVLRDEMFGALKVILDQMEPLDHEIITMRCFEELTNSEAAESLGITQNGASSRFVRAMTRLRRQMGARSQVE